MKKTAILTLCFVAASYPAMASAHHHHHRHYRGHHHTSDHRASGGVTPQMRAHITCDMVRAYVAQVGIRQARAMALSAGMTASDERKARRCIESRV